VLVELMRIVERRWKLLVFDRQLTAKPEKAFIGFSSSISL
jgi:hypothetical protein